MLYICVMKAQLTIDKKHQTTIAAFCKTELEKIAKDRDLAKIEFDRREKELLDLLSDIGGLNPIDSIPNNFNANEYNPDWSFSKKAEYILDKSDSYMSTRAILDVIYSLEPKLKEDKNRHRDLHSKLSSSLIQKMKLDTTPFLRKQTVNGILYGLKLKNPNG